MDIGVFKRVNQYDGLYYRDIISCLSPVFLITDVPVTIHDDELEEILRLQQCGFDCFDGSYGSYALMEPFEWFHDGPKWKYTMRFDTLIRDARKTAKLDASAVGCSQKWLE